MSRTSKLPQEIIDDALFPWSITVVRDITRAIISYPGLQNHARRLAIALLFDYGYPVSADDLAIKLGLSRRAITEGFVHLRRAKLIIENSTNINRPIAERDIRLDVRKLLKHYIEFERVKWQKKKKI